VGQGAVRLGILEPTFPQEAIENFVKIYTMMVEPLNYIAADLPPEALNKNGAYRWGFANLPKRVAKQAGQAALSQHFKTPLKEFTLLSRKLLGVFSLIDALKAEFDARPLARRYLLQE